MFGRNGDHHDGVPIHVLTHHVDDGDELEIHLVPVLLGGGRRLFEPTGSGHVELELVRRLEARDVTHLRYRVLRSE